MTQILRPYQAKIVSAIRSEYTSGNRRVILRCATGAGKTTIFGHILKAYHDKNIPALVCVRGKTLVSQASARLTQMGIEHGVFMQSKKTNHPIQCVSIDTAHSRVEYPNAKLIVIDECHDATSDAYREFLAQYPDAFVLGVSATPFGDLSHVGSKIISPVSVTELIGHGYLVPLRYFAPSTIDVSSVRIDSKTRDFRINELAAASQKGTITGDIVEHWKKLAHGRPTLAFCVNIQHAQNMAAAFNAAGIKSTALVGTDPQERRKFCFDNLGSYYKVITSVGVLTRGVDIPHASCLVIARPTQSLALWTQIQGRGTRPAPGKEDCLVLDHAGNCARFGRAGFLENEPALEELSTIGTKSSGKPLGPSVYTCGSCFGVAVRPIEACPYCGVPVSIEKRNEPKFEAGELVEIIPVDKNKLAIQKSFEQGAAVSLEELISLGQKRGYNYPEQWARHILLARKNQPKKKDVDLNFLPKPCSMCEKIFPRSEFKHSQRCKKCAQKYRKLHYLKNREKEIERQRQLRQSTDFNTYKRELLSKQKQQDPLAYKEMTNRRNAKRKSRAKNI